VTDSAPQTMRLDSLKARIAGADYVIDPYAVADALLHSLAFRCSADGMLVAGEMPPRAARGQDNAGSVGAHRPDAGKAGGV
jgi:hypothetical protein